MISKRLPRINLLILGKSGRGKEKIEELKIFNKDGLFIHEYFSELCNEIDVEREVVKLKIDDHYLKLIDEVNDLEEKCVSKSADSNNLIEDEAEKFEGKLENFRVEFDKLEIDFDKWESVREGSKYQLKDLNEKILKFENDLLLNHIYTFESNATLFLVANKASKIIAKKSFRNLCNHIRLHGRNLNDPTTRTQPSYVDSGTGGKIR